MSALHWSEDQSRMSRMRRQATCHGWTIFFFRSSLVYPSPQRQPEIGDKKIHKTQLKPPPWWKPVLLRLLLRHRKCKYNDDTAVKYTITHALPTGILGMSNTVASSDISRVMSVWAIFHPLGHPYNSSCSYYIKTLNYTKILHTRLYHIIIAVGDVLGILFSSSLRCLFLHCSWSRHLIFTTLQHGICFSISAFARNVTMKRWI
jgi:hypothetical protein